MTILFPTDRHFSFRSRPTPVPGDLRIGWRLPILLLMLGYSRKSKASLAKLHIINDAVRSPRARNVLQGLIAKTANVLEWQPRVEPAFGRALNFAVGERFAEWIRVSDRAGIQLTTSGLKSFKAVAAFEDALLEERPLVSSLAAISESFVSRLLRFDPTL